MSISSVLRILFLWLIATTPLHAFGQNTVGTLQMTAGLQEGYILFSPSGSTSTYLIDRCGRVMNQWEADARPGLSTYFMENGDLLRTHKMLSGTFIAGGIGGGIDRFNWDGELIWSDTIANDTLHLHHDIEPLPNGNVLAIAWEKITSEEAIARGRNPDFTPDFIWVTRLLELHPIYPSGSEVVWSWSPWDHLIQDTDPELPNFGNPSDYPHRFDVNHAASTFFSGPGLGQNAASDWLHVNSVDYHAQRDEIILSSRNWNEIWIIDHSTSEEEAASSAGGNSGKGGQILWRWGNPEAYSRGDSSDQVFFGQHDAQFILHGTSTPQVAVFNNGLYSPDGNFSFVHRLNLPLDASGGYIEPEWGEAFLPIAPAWTHPPEPDSTIFSRNISGYHPYAPDHNLICIGSQGRFLDVSDSHEILWEYTSPINGFDEPVEQGVIPFGNDVFRSTWIPYNHPGFSGLELIPGNPIELNPSIDACLALDAGPTPSDDLIFDIWPIPADDFINMQLPNSFLDGRATLVIFSVDGRMMHRSSITQELQIETGHWPAGVYIASVTTQNRMISKKLILK